MTATVSAADLLRMGYVVEGGVVRRVADPLNAPPRPLPEKALESFEDPEGYTHYVFTLYGGAPRTKKNHSQAARTGKECPACKLRMGPAKVFPSKQYRAWEKSVLEFVMQRPELRLHLDQPVAVKALVYRDRNAGDFDGYMQALGDVMQEACIILDDRQIAHRDGSRLRVDTTNPRIEIDLTVLGSRMVQEGLAL